MRHVAMGVDEVPEVKRSSNGVVFERSDPRRDCLKAEGRSSNLKAGLAYVALAQ